MRVGIIVAAVIVVVALVVVFGLGPITDIVSGGGQKSKQWTDEVGKALGQPDINFAIYPQGRWDAVVGSGFGAVAGIKNDAADGIDHTFVVNVVPIQVSADVLNTLRSKNGGGACTSIDNCNIQTGQAPMTLRNFMKSWFTWTYAPFPVLSNQFATRPIAVTVPASAPVGTYQFGFVSCMVGQNITKMEDCGIDTSNWGSLQTLDLHITKS